MHKYKFVGEATVSCFTVVKINKNSWHYALLDGYNGGDVPNTLCRYFNSLVCALISIFVF